MGPRGTDSAFGARSPVVGELERVCDPKTLPMHLKGKQT